MTNILLYFEYMHVLHTMTCRCLSSSSQLGLALIYLRGKTKNNEVSCISNNYICLLLHQHIPTELYVKSLYSIGTYIAVVTFTMAGRNKSLNVILFLKTQLHNDIVQRPPGVVLENRIGGC